MSKPLLVIQCPCATRSGYGDHSRDILRSLYKIDRFDIKIVPTRWGNTPMNQLTGNTEFERNILRNIITTLDRKPDVFIQVSVANEFKPLGEFNIGITAGVESTAAPKDFLEGCNRMDLIITPSNFTRDTLIKTGYNQVDQRTNEVVGVYKLEKTVEVLHEGLNLEVFNKIQWV